MAVFTPNQRVVTTRNTPLLTITGDTLAPDLPTGTVVTIVTGPFQIVGRAGEFWSITGNGRTGYVNASRIEPYNDAPNPPGQGTNRRIWVGVPEGGDGHEVNRANFGGGYVKADPAHDFFLNYNPGVFAVATEYEWNEILGDWVFKIENRGQGGEFLFQDPFGWVQFEHGTSRDDRLNRLEVYKKDNGPALPKFEFPPSVETPPPPPPPIEEPPMPEPVDTTGQIANGGFEGGVKPTPPGVSGLLPEGWELLWYADANTPKIERQDSPWAAPEIMVNNAGQLTADILPLPEGSKCLHIFKGWAPTWCKLGRKVHLTPGIYHLSCDFFFDPVAEYTTPKTYGLDPITSEVRMFLDGIDVPLFANQTFHAPGHWRPLHNLNVVVTAEGDRTLILEFRGRFGMRHNGCFIDNVRLVKQGTLPPVDPPPDDDDEIDLWALSAELKIIKDAVARIEGLMS